VFYRCCASRRHVAAYARLTSSPFASGRRTREQGISKRGNAHARKTLIELAWLRLRNQPDGALAAWFRSRVGPFTVTADHNKGEWQDLRRMG
jgi:transposase